jgi:hypothetical protein
MAYINSCTPSLADPRPRGSLHGYRTIALRGSTAARQGVDRLRERREQRLGHSREPGS